MGHCYASTHKDCAFKIASIWTHSIHDDTYLLSHVLDGERVMGMIVCSTHRLNSGSGCLYHAHLQQSLAVVGSSAPQPGWVIFTRGRFNHPAHGCTWALMIQNWLQNEELKHDLIHMCMKGWKSELESKIYDWNTKCGIWWFSNARHLIGVDHAIRKKYAAPQSVPSSISCFVEIIPKEWEHLQTCEMTCYCWSI